MTRYRLRGDGPLKFRYARLPAAPCRECGKASTFEALYARNGRCRTCFDGRLAAATWYGPYVMPQPGYDTRPAAGPSTVAANTIARSRPLGDPLSPHAGARPRAGAAPYCRRLAAGFAAADPDAGVDTACADWKTIVYLAAARGPREIALRLPPGSLAVQTP